MILGMTLLTFIHVLLSLIGIVAGLVVLSGLLNNRRMDGWTALFLATTIATNATGIGFGFGPTPALNLAYISLVVLAVAVIARYGFRLRGLWRAVYVIGAVAALYFNVFVLVVQAFAKIDTLRALAPTRTTEIPYVIVQGVVLVAFLVAGFLAVRRFRPAA